MSPTMQPCLLNTFRYFAAGKRPSQRIAATESAGNHLNSRLFYVTDRETKRRFLVNTGAKVSVVPPTPQEQRRAGHGPQLCAINASPLTYDEKSLALDIGLRRNYKCRCSNVEILSPPTRCNPSLYSKWNNFFTVHSSSGISEFVLNMVLQELLCAMLHSVLQIRMLLRRMVNQMWCLN